MRWCRCNSRFKTFRANHSGSGLPNGDDMRVFRYCLYHFRFRSSPIAFKRGICWRRSNKYYRHWWPIIFSDFLHRLYLGPTLQLHCSGHCSVKTQSLRFVLWLTGSAGGWNVLVRNSQMFLRRPYWRPCLVANFVQPQFLWTICFWCVCNCGCTGSHHSRIVRKCLHSEWHILFRFSHSSTHHQTEAFRPGLDQLLWLFYHFHRTDGFLPIFDFRWQPTFFVSSKNLWLTVSMECLA